MVLPALLWFLALAALGALALPVAAALFAPVESRGAGFAPVLGLAWLCLGALWVGQLAFAPVVAWGVGLALVVPAGLALARGTTVPWRRYGEVLLVLAVAFGLAVAIRARSPALVVWAEGYLNMGIVASLLRTASLPPPDVWFAGEPVRYYYGGHLIAAALASMAGTAVPLVPNLAVPAFFAALVAAAYDLGGAVGYRRGVPRRLGAVLSALSVGLAGTSYDALRIAVGWLPDATARSLWTGLGLEAGALGGDFSAHAATHFGSYPTDVPLYAVLIGSLHAHVSSRPFLVLVAGLCFALYRTPAESRRRRLGRLAAITPAVGVVGFVDLWSLPAAAGLAGLTVALAADHPITLLPRGRLRATLAGDPSEGARSGGVDDALASVRSALGRYGGGAILTVMIAAGALLSVLPFVLVTAPSRPLGLFPARDAAGQLLVTYGWLLAGTALFLALRLRPAVASWRSGVAAVGALVILVGVATYGDVPAVALLGPILLAGWWVLCRTRGVGSPAAPTAPSARGGDGETEPSPGSRSDGGRAGVGSAGFETVVVLAAAGLLVLVQFVFVRGGAEPGRFNTAFRLHSQAWLLWTLVAGPVFGALLVPGLARLLDAARLPRTRRRVRFRRLRAALGGSTAVALVAALLVVAGLAFGALGVAEGLTGATGPGPTGTLDATRVLDTLYPEVADARGFLADRPGQPTIVEAAPTEVTMLGYLANPYSSTTGVPTVAGWTHAAIYHGEARYAERVADVRTIYEGDDARRAALLRAYDVAYVVVGPYERTRYDVADLAAQPGLTPRRFGAVSIFTVDRDALEPLPDERRPREAADRAGRS